MTNKMIQSMLLAAALLLGSALLQAQDEAPQPAGSEGPQAISSIAQPRVQSSLTERSFVVPRLTFYQVYDSRPQYGLSPVNEYDMFSHVSGRLDFQRVERTSRFTAGYNGGLIVSDRTRNHAHFHEASLAQEFMGRRTTVLLSNTFRYTPASEFGLRGFGSFGGLGSIARALGNLRPELNPGQGLITQPASQYSNAVAAELRYSVGPRSMITASGSYGLLRFREAGFSEVDQYGFSYGLNHQVSARDTFSAYYAGQLLRITGGTEILSHSIHAGIGRQISGRLKVEASGGPQISRLNFVLPGFDRTTVGASVRSALKYVTPRADVTASYTRGISGGAGVLSGAQSDQVNVDLSSQLSRTWRGSLHTGYVRTSGVRRTPQSGTNFNSVVAGAGLHRPIARTADAFINYRWYRQVATLPGFDLNRHTVSVGISWNPSAIRLDQ